MYCSEFEITFMYVNLELDGTLFHTYTHHLHICVAKQNLFFVFFLIISICAKSEFNTCMNDATFLLMRKNQNQYCEHIV